MEWHVYAEDINRRCIENYNIFEHDGFAKYVKQWLKECNTKEEFAERLKRELQYYFWSRCEWEVIISEWPPTKNRAEEIKIDVYDQVMLNWDIFLNYVWSFKGSD